MSLGLVRLTATNEGLYFEIVEGSAGEGFYVLRYENGSCTHDYLQNDIEMGKRCALHQFRVPMSAWQSGSQGQRPMFEHDPLS